jgi:hypothetical protein
MSKRDMADRILDQVLVLRSAVTESSRQKV